MIGEVMGEIAGEMTGGLLISLYLFTLAAFLGMDVIRKVPPTLYGALAAAVGAAAALAVVVALPSAGASRPGVAAALTTVAVMIGSAGVVGGLLRLRRLSHKRGGK
jgi:NAD(P) transhydrogenase subunit alpha